MRASRCNTKSSTYPWLVQLQLSSVQQLSSRETLADTIWDLDAETTALFFDSVVGDAIGLVVFFSINLFNPAMLAAELVTVWNFLGTDPSARCMYLISRCLVAMTMTMITRPVSSSHLCLVLRVRVHRPGVPFSVWRIAHNMQRNVSGPT